jgi:DNA modification methylase
MARGYRAMKLKDYEYFRTDLGVLYKGDCLEILPLIDKVDLVLTDPPYNIDLQPQRKKTDAIQNDCMSKDDFISFISYYFKKCNSILKDDSFLFSFLGWPTIPEFRTVLDKLFTLKSMPIWVKNNFGIGYYTRPQYEPCLFYLKGKPKVLKNPISDVWRIKKVQNPIHSCQKPVALYELIIDNFSKKGDIVFDGFFGVGGLAIACEKLGRRWIGIEISEKYCEIAKQRIKAESDQFKMF